jgi:CheY-like chemotaxis protein
MLPRPLKILLVDDHTGTLDSMSYLLHRWGYKVFAAQEPEEALQKVSAEQPDFVILDLGLPGMSGLDVAREIRDRSIPHRPTLIAHTGHARPIHEELTRQAGFDFMLVKPVAPEDLKKVLDWYS